MKFNLAKRKWSYWSLNEEKFGVFPPFHSKREKKCKTRKNPKYYKEYGAISFTISSLGKF